MILPIGRWRPTRSDVAAAEPVLQSAIASGVSVDGRLRKIAPEQLARYRRQYVGEGSPEKRRLAIYLNCRLKDWPHRIAWARGGGRAS